MRRGDFNFDKVCSDSKGAKERRMMSGSTVGLQWVYSESRMNKRQIQNKDIMEVNKETIGSFQLCQSLKLWQSPYWKRECRDAKTVRAT